MKTPVYVFLILVCFASVAAAKPAPTIAFNQIGYYPQSEKVAAIVDAPELEKFQLVDANTGKVVYSGKLGKPVPSKNSSAVTRRADFTRFTTSGTYCIVAGTLKSAPFTLGTQVYHDVAKGVLTGFYHQRATGHPDTLVYIHSSAATKERPAGTMISSPRGWYDAGDYNKYIVNSGITMGTLFAACEDFPDYFKALEVDILDEAAFNLRWMLTMQDPHDGGVYHKLTNADFDALNARPGETKAPRYVVQKGTAAALDFAAVCAQAARVYKDKKAYPGLADSCLRAAQQAWAWASKNPQVEYAQEAMNQKHQPPVNTGAYGDKNFADEWFWAAAELYVTTRDALYKKQIDAHINDAVTIPSWANVHTLGVYSLLRHKVAGYAETSRPKVLAAADELLAGIPTNAFGVVMGGKPSDFIWGSSSVAANQGILLLQAYSLTSDKRYLTAAASNVDYLLGKNATGYCFVTGFGSHSVKHPHHRPSVSDGIEEPVPGLLSGGPNTHAPRQDSATYPFTEPETTFVDNEQSYASNEIAINWNAPAVYLFNAVEFYFTSQVSSVKR